MFQHPCIPLMAFMCLKPTPSPPRHELFVKDCVQIDWFGLPACRMQKTLRGPAGHSCSLGSCRVSAVALSIRMVATHLVNPGSMHGMMGFQSERRAKQYPCAVNICKRVSLSGRLRLSMLVRFCAPPELFTLTLEPPKEANSRAALASSWDIGSSK